MADTGTATVLSHYRTAGGTVNAAEPRLMKDMAPGFDGLVAEADWHHDAIDGTADARRRALHVGPAAPVPPSSGTPASAAGGRYWSSSLPPLSRTIGVRVP